MVMLKKEISRTAEEIDGDDVLSVKKELKNMGYYKENEKVGMNKFTDEGLFKGISSFQKDNKLKVDEVMKPGGETESKINEVRGKSDFRTDFENRKFATIRKNISEGLDSKKDNESFTKRFVNNYKKLEYMNDIPKDITTGNKVVDKVIGKVVTKGVEKMVKNSKAKLFVKAAEKIWPYAEQGGAYVARVKAAYDETNKK